MKKISIILSMFFLCGTLCTAQKIDKQTYEQWVDYVVCKSATSFLNAQKDNKAYETNYSEYTTKIKPKLEQISLNKPLSINQLENFINCLDWVETAKVFVELEKKLKEQYRDDASLETVFSWFSDGNPKMQEYIDYNVQIIKIIVTNDRTKATIEQQIGSLDERVKTLKQKLELNNNIIYGILVLLLIVVLFLVVKQNFKGKKPEKGGGDNLKDDGIDNAEENLRKIFSKEKEKFEQELNSLKSEIKKLEKELSGKIEDCVKETLQKTSQKEKKTKDQKSKIKKEQKFQQEKNEKNNLKKNKNGDDSQDEEDTDKEVPETSQSNVKYLKEKQGKVLFKERPKEEAYYEIFNIQGKNAQYKFCGNEKRAIDNYNGVLEGIFDDEKSYIPNSKKHVKHIAAGTVTEKEDGSWEIQTLAKIKFS